MIIHQYHDKNSRNSRNMTQHENDATKSWQDMIQYDSNNLKVSVSFTQYDIRIQNKEMINKWIKIIKKNFFFSYE